MRTIEDFTGCRKDGGNENGDRFKKIDVKGNTKERLTEGEDEEGKETGETARGGCVWRKKKRKKRQKQSRVEMRG